jgi:hypothetical protein
VKEARHEHSVVNQQAWKLKSAISIGEWQQVDQQIILPITGGQFIDG